MIFLVALPASSKLARRGSGPSQGGRRVFGALDGGSPEYDCTTSVSHDHKHCEVCHLLTRDKPVTSAAAAAAAASLPQWKRVD